MNANARHPKSQDKNLPERRLCPGAATFTNCAATPGAGIAGDRDLFSSLRAGMIVRYDETRYRSPRFYYHLHQIAPHLRVDINEKRFFTTKARSTRNRKIGRVIVVRLLVARFFEVKSIPSPR
jgi:hypothetical protein